MSTIGGTDIADIKLGNVDIEKVYLGSDVVWEKESGDEYEICNYIENTSNGYIDTGVSFYSINLIGTPHLIMSVEVLTAPSAWKGIFGSRYKSGDPDTCAVQVSNKNKWFTRINSSDYSLNISIFGQHTITLQNHKCYVDDVAFTESKSIPRYSGATVALLGTHNRTTDTFSDLGLNCRVYSCQMFGGETLVRDYIPVRQKSTGLYGLLDRVNNVFYTSPNGTLFSGG